MMKLTELGFVRWTSRSPGLGWFSSMGHGPDHGTDP